MKELAIDMYAAIDAGQFKRVAEAMVEVATGFSRDEAFDPEYTGESPVDPVDPVI
jgi:hypothetical protein